MPLRRISVGSWQDTIVCILAHNEQKHIASTIKSIIEGNREIDFKVIVYANGCTDNTIKIVKSFLSTYSNLRLRELDRASKSHAWNTAFYENKESILVFSDGDVEPEPGSIATLLNCFKIDSEITLASCQFWPRKNRLLLEQRLTGFMQIPLVQDFLTGCFYGVERKKLETEFNRHNLPGIPDGIVGEDYFLSVLLPGENFTVIKKKCYYEPPVFNDYQKYLARIRWQEEQIAYVCKKRLASSVEKQKKLIDIINKKITYYQGPVRLLIGFMSATMRYAFIFFYRKKIYQYYQALGPVVYQGESILSSATRSSSAK